MIFESSQGFIALDLMKVNKDSNFMEKDQNSFKFNQ